MNIRDQIKKVTLQIRDLYRQVGNDDVNTKNLLANPDNGIEKLFIDGKEVGGPITFIDSVIDGYDYANQSIRTTNMVQFGTNKPMNVGDFIEVYLDGPSQYAASLYFEEVKVNNYLIGSSGVVGSDWDFTGSSYGNIYGNARFMVVCIAVNEYNVYASGPNISTSTSS